MFNSYREYQYRKRIMKVIIGCEFSGVVRRAFTKLGHDVYSCDLLPSTDNSDKHIVGDIRDLTDDWDLGIFHPPSII